MTEFEKAVINKLDDILAEMRAAREERAEVGDASSRMDRAREACQQRYPPETN